jgi:hypothetical protein
VYIAFALPPQLASAAGFRRLSIYYSNTELGETPRWSRFRRVRTEQTSSNSLGRFKDDSHGAELSNSAMIILNSCELVLQLHHFCMFTVVVDGRKETAKMASIETFAKISVSSRSFAVDVSVLVGCDEREMVCILRDVKTFEFNNRVRTVFQF